MNPKFTASVNKISSLRAIFFVVFLLLPLSGNCANINAGDCLVREYEKATNLADDLWLDIEANLREQPDLYNKLKLRVQKQRLFRKIQLVALKYFLIHDVSMLKLNFKMSEWIPDWSNIDCGPQCKNMVYESLTKDSQFMELYPAYDKLLKEETVLLKTDSYRESLKALGEIFGQAKIMDKVVAVLEAVNRNAYQLECEGVDQLK